jgi:hypothetical protein
VLIILTRYDLFSFWFANPHKSSDLIFRKQEDILSPFFLDAEALSRIDEILDELCLSNKDAIIKSVGKESYKGEIAQAFDLHANKEFRVKFLDNSSNIYVNIDDIARLPNTGGRTISEIEIIAGGHRYNYIKMTLTSRRFFENISYDSAGSEEKISSYLNKLYLIDNMKPWYSFFYKYRLSIIISFLIISIFLYFMTKHKDFFIGDGSSANQIDYIMMSIFVASTSIAILSWTGKVIKFLLPREQFLIGGGIKRKENRDRIAGVLFLVIVLGIAVNLLSSYIFTHH